MQVLEPLSGDKDEGSHRGTTKLHPSLCEAMQDSRHIYTDHEFITSLQNYEV